jgi:hypothetical protein
VLRFADNLSVTRPSGFDICYWHEGLEPDINFAAHLRVLRGSVTDLFTQTPWLAYLAVWFAVQWAMGFVAVKPRRFPSLALLLGVASFLGIALYCLIRMEPRYIGPYLFLGFVGLTTLLRYPVGDAAVLRKTLLCSGLLIGLCLGYVAVFSIDQTVRGLYTVGNKPSYRDAYEEIVAVKEFLLSRGVQKGDFAAVIGAPPDYWGRMAGLRIISEIKDQDEFIRSGPAKRKSAVDALIRSRVKAVVAKGSRFNELAREGWERAPHTTDYFVLILVDHGKTPG